MCGRYTLTEVDPHKIASRFGEFDEHGIDPDTLGRFNVCPTETIVTVDSEGPRAVRWGLVPSYAKKLNQGPMLINARNETVATKAPFAVQYILEAVHHGLEQPFDKGQFLEATLFGLVASTSDMREGTTAFLEKRKPSFKGE